MKVIYQVIDKREFSLHDLSTNFLCERDRDHLLYLSSIGKRHDFVLGRNFVKCFLENYTNMNFEKLDLEFSACGKPNIKNSRFHFNLSHSGNYLIAVASHNDCGVDLQREEQLNSPVSLWERIAHEEELLSNLHLSQRGILRRWTQKEAISKCYGNSGTPDFSKINLSKAASEKSVNWEGQKFFIKTIPFQAGEDYYFCEVAVKADTEDRPIELVQVDWFERKTA